MAWNLRSKSPGGAAEIGGMPFCQGLRFLTFGYVKDVG